MSLLWSTTAQNAVANGIKIGVYGRDGSGKTTLIPTCPLPLIADVEGKTLSIAASAIPSVRITTWADFEELYQFFLSSGHAKNFDTLCVDSVSTLAEILLAEEKRKSKDARRAYQESRDKLSMMLRNLCALPQKNVFFSCKAAMIDQPDGTKIFAPSLPGTTPDSGIGYYLNELLFLDLGSYAGPVNEKGEPTVIQYRFLQTQQTIYAQARDNSLALAPQEKPHLGEIFNKIRTAFGAQPQ